MHDSRRKPLREEGVVRDIEDLEEGTCKLWRGRVANCRMPDGLAGGEA